MKKYLHIVFKAVTIRDNKVLSTMRVLWLLTKKSAGMPIYFNKNIHKSLEIMYANLRV